MNRTTYFDVLNILSCISVVLLHSNGFVHSYSKDEFWGLHVVIETLFTFAVPVFFMLSGATLFNYRTRYSTKVFAKKRITKTFIPYCFWSTIFFILYILTHEEINHSPFTWRIIVSRILTGEIPFTNYWFFIPLFYLYLFIPFISLMVKVENNRELKYLCIILVIFQSVIPTILTIIGVESNIPLPITGYIMYSLIGYLFSLIKIEKNNSFMILLSISAVISLITRAYLLYHFDIYHCKFHYFGLYALLPSCAIFLITKRLFSKKKTPHLLYVQALPFLASKSYGVFLFHTFFIRLFDKVSNLDMNDVLFIPIAFFSSYITSILLVLVLQKNKITKHLVP